MLKSLKTQYLLKKFFDAQYLENNRCYVNEMRYYFFHIGIEKQPSNKPKTACFQAVI